MSAEHSKGYFAVLVPHFACSARACNLRGSLYACFLESMQSVEHLHLRVEDACSASSWQVVFGPTKRNVSLPFPLTCNCPTGQPDKVDGQLCFDDGIGLEILSPRLATPRSMQSHSDLHRRKNTVYTEMVSPASS